MEEDKYKRITELSNSDFLSFLFSERAREEDLNTYQGWNNWAVSGALVTVFCAGYAVLKNFPNGIDVLNTAYYLSGLLALFLFFRPISVLLRRTRGVDYRKVKKLKDVAPKHHLVMALICSCFFPVFFFLNNHDHPWSILTIFWLIAAILYIGITLLVFFNRDSIVRPDIDGLLFPGERYERLLGGITGAILGELVAQSFKMTTGAFIGSPDFELAVCLAAIVILFYLLAKINLRETMSSRLDVLIDDFLYKGRSKESIYQQILISRMGYSALEACSRELIAMSDTVKVFDHKKRKIEEVGALFASGTFDRNLMKEYLHVIQEGKETSVFMFNMINSLVNKIEKITEVEPELAETEEYKTLLAIGHGLIKNLSDYLKIANDAADKVDIWVRVYHCKKYGGWCVKKCKERYDKPSLGYKIEMIRMRFFRNLSSIVKIRDACK